MQRYMKQTAEKLRAAGKRHWTVCAGFDGYIDTLCRPVAGAEGTERKPFATIREFGEYLTGKAGKSCLIDLMEKTVRAGGNAPIFAGAVSSLAPETRLIGCLGMPERRGEFSGLLKNVRCTAIGDPGLCTALEFNDGKIMLSDNTGVQKLDYRRLTERLPEEELKKDIAECDLLALMNWSEMPGMTDIWRGILNGVPAEELAGKRVFIDVSDCSYRSTEDILEMLSLVRRFADRAEVLFSMNENESIQIAGRLDIRAEDMRERLERLRDPLGGALLSVHSVYRAYILGEDGYTEAATRHIDRPRISTGAGDHFNAGLACGWMEDYSAAEMLTLANAVSSTYVEDGVTPTRERLIEVLTR